MLWYDTAYCLRIDELLTAIQQPRACQPTVQRCEQLHSDIKNSRRRVASLVTSYFVRRCEVCIMQCALWLTKIGHEADRSVSKKSDCRKSSLSKDFSRDNPFNASLNMANQITFAPYQYWLQQATGTPNFHRDFRRLGVLPNHPTPTSRTIPESHRIKPSASGTSKMSPYFC